MSTWKQIVKTVPADGATVWIIRLHFYDTPFQATFDEANDGFWWVDSNTVTHLIPLWFVAKWRPL